MLAAAGHYVMNVSDKGVTMDFHACDALVPTERYRLAGEARAVRRRTSGVRLVGTRQKANKAQ